MNRKLLFTMLFFGCFGMTTEIFTVAISNLINQTPLWDEPLLSLTGKTYIWMFPIYMCIPIIGGPLFRVMQAYNILVRLLVYTLVIFSVEFATGWLLDLLTGKCPWEYTTGWHLMGYIKLNMAPLWAGFSLLLERLYVFLDHRLH